MSNLYKFCVIFSDKFWVNFILNLVGRIVDQNFEIIWEKNAHKILCTLAENFLKSFATVSDFDYAVAEFGTSVFSQRPNETGKMAEFRRISSNRFTKGSFPSLGKKTSRRYFEKVFLKFLSLICEQIPKWQRKEELITFFLRSGFSFVEFDDDATFQFPQLFSRNNTYGALCTQELSYNDCIKNCDSIHSKFPPLLPSTIGASNHNLVIANLLKIEGFFGVIEKKFFL